MTEVEIRSVAAGGDGVGTLPDGMTVFVPRAAPGDRLAVTVTERKPRWARGDIATVLRPGSERVVPPCVHYGRDRCGGCQLQHLEYAAQLRVKAKIVGDALRRIGKLDMPDPEIISAQDPWRYRAKITLGHADGRLGFHRVGEPAEVFDLEDCLIARESLRRLLEVVRNEPSFLPASLGGVVLKEDSQGGLHVVVLHTGTWRPSLPAALAGVASVWRAAPNGRAPKFVGGIASDFPPMSFEQINPELAPRLRRDAIEALDVKAGETAWDLYGGAGDTAYLLAGAGARVWSVDADPNAIRVAETRIDGVDVTFAVGMVENTLARLPRPDLIVVNPPRAGLGAKAALLLAERAQGARALAYVSCDPATLARDASKLDGFEPVWARAYDLFPQTSHVETLMLLRRVG